jgi:hypothetical protein
MLGIHSPPRGEVVARTALQVAALQGPALQGNLESQPPPSTFRCRIASRGTEEESGWLKELLGAFFPQSRSQPMR